MLAEAARVLGRLPVTRGLFSEQKLSWSQVRGIVTRLRRMPVDDLAEIDARVAASVERIDAYSPDELVWAVERAADEINGARKVQRREQRQIAANFLAVQPWLDGAVSLYGELDSVAGATVLNALDAASELRTSATGYAGEPSSRAKQRAKDCHASARLAGRRQRARGPPRRVVPVDLAQVTITAAGLVELAAPGGLPTPTAATVERLSQDADLRVVIFDRARPLAVSSKTRAARIPAETRLAVGARDRGCRFPGSTAPCAGQTATTSSPARTTAPITPKTWPTSPDAGTSWSTARAGSSTSTPKPGSSPSRATAAPGAPSLAGYPSGGPLRSRPNRPTTSSRSKRERSGPFAIARRDVHPLAGGKTGRFVGLSAVPCSPVGSPAQST
ncbi:MAG: DUF222 domain-containing protein [Actinomycetota bacterium]|nr:DUF222 domain-containing protein [Actinomycetota bacterium]